MGHHTRHWGWLIFFSMQAPIIAAETAIRQQLKRHHIQLPLLVRMPLTIGILLAIADNFFFPPVFLSGLADHVVELMQQNIDGVLSLTGWTADIAL